MLIASPFFKNTSAYVKTVSFCAWMGIVSFSVLLSPIAHAILPTLLDVPPDMIVSDPAPAAFVHALPAPLEPAAKDLPSVRQASLEQPTAPEPKLEATPQASVTVPNTPSENTALVTALTAQHQAINNLLRDQETEALTDVGVLWQTAVERSGTIRFAIEKLSRKNAVGVDPNDADFSKRLIQSLARVGGAASTMMTGTPAGLVGGSIVNDLVQGNPKQSPLSIVTDADMLLLAKEVEALQSQLLTSYYTYRHAKERLALAQQGQQEIRHYQALISPSDASQNATLWGPLSTTLTAGLDDSVIKAQQEYLSARQNLGLLVGMETLETMENTTQKTALK